MSTKAEPRGSALEYKLTLGLFCQSVWLISVNYYLTILVCNVAKVTVTAVDPGTIFAAVVCPAP